MRRLRKQSDGGFPTLRQVAAADGTSSACLPWSGNIHGLSRRLLTAGDSLHAPSGSLFSLDSDLFSLFYLPRAGVGCGPSSLSVFRPEKALLTWVVSSECMVFPELIMTVLYLRPLPFYILFKGEGGLRSRLVGKRKKKWEGERKTVGCCICMVLLRFIFVFHASPRLPLSSILPPPSLTALLLSSPSLPLTLPLLTKVAAIERKKASGGALHSSLLKKEAHLWPSRLLDFPFMASPPAVWAAKVKSDSGCASFL